VVFDSNGGSVVATQTVNDGSTVAKPADPTNGSHVLISWFNGDTQYDFAAKVTSDLVLKAKWTTTVESKVRYDSSWELTVNDKVTKVIGYVVLDCINKTFENYNVVNGGADLKYTGTYSETGSSITFTISSRGLSTEYSISGNTWTYSSDPSMFGFGNKSVTTTTVTKTVLETVEQ